MTAALKRVVVPALRDLGFAGTFPHFRRAADDRTDLLSVQFSQWDDKFAVEVGVFPAAGYASGGATLPAADVRMRHLLFGTDRTRVGPPDADGDRWFDFTTADPDAVAAAVLKYVRNQAARWWGRHRS
jgi:hypothetical protein